ncbi:MAG TPA: O-methyltransferase [Pyrinomonadaceae bacterium]|jgi:predicted O-methyltransferase YrrM|nr:O-methyltransferase [Pyrinomonadaceae bacterium]
MKARVDAIIQRDQAEYLNNLTRQNDPLLAEMEAYASEHRVPIADREVALFLEITARSIAAKKALEIGMAIGYSVIYLARGMGEGGKVVTIEPSDEMINAATMFLKRANLSDNVQIQRGKALDVMPQLTDTFDLLYIDAVKEEYAQYLDRGLPLLRSGGVVIVDNLLWGGRVAQAATANDEQSTRSLREFNRYFMNHPQLRSEILSVGDGLGYAVKIA